MINLLAMVPLDDEGPASGPFALIQGLPVHPLVVHAAVVLIPLAALGLILMSLIPKFGAKLGWLVTLTALVATGAAFVAKESGEQLEKMVGEPGFDHAEWGDRMPVVAGILFLACLILWLAQRSWAKREGGNGLMVILGIVGIFVAGASLFFVYKVGDTGARSVWEGEVSTSSAPAESDDDAPTPQASASPAESASATATTAAITAAEVAQHNTPDDCWTSINGTVYNVTAWIDQHPGGEQRILNLCGIDGTSQFDGQHEGQPKPETTLAGFEVGTLS